MPWTSASAVPVVQRCLEALVANMAAIAPPNYKTTVKTALLYDSSIVGHPLTAPAIVVFPGDDRALRHVTGKYYRTMDVRIRAAINFAARSTSWKREIQDLMADIQMAIRNDLQLGGEASAVHVQSITVPDADLHSGLAAAELRADLMYGFRFDDPSVVT